MRNGWYSISAGGGERGRQGQSPVDDEGEMRVREVRTVDDRLVLREPEELVPVLEAPVGDGELAGELAVVDHLLEHLPEGLELAGGDDKRVVHEQQVGLEAEALE